MMRRAVFWFLGLAIAGWAAPSAAVDRRAGEPPKVPVALAWGPGGRLFVALRDARQVVAVDPIGWRVVACWDVPVRPASLVAVDDRTTLLVGGMDGELLVLDAEGRVVRELRPGRGALRIVPLAGGRAMVASPWDAAVFLVDWREGRRLATHSLPFAPGAMVGRPDGRIVVADAFGGGLADFVPGEAGSVRRRSIDGVNLRALGISGDGKEVLIAHMVQEEAAPITVANIDRGAVLSSRLSAVRLSDFAIEAPAGSPLALRSVTLDGPVHGAADPSAMAISADGTLVVLAMAGSHQLLKSDRTHTAPSSAAPDLLSLGHNQRIEGVEVGRTPVALVLDPSGRVAVTADAMSDRLSVVALDGLAVLTSIPFTSGPLARTSAQRGEALFQDGRRSHDRWMSCASCHNLGHTNGLNFDTRGDGGYGAPKNTPSLLGVAATAPYTWTGEFARLEDQVDLSLRSSLHGPSPAPGVVEDLTAYLATLAPPPPRRRGDDPAALRGTGLFRARRCDSCHRPPHYTIDGVRDVGLDDGGGGHRRFNPPSLLGVSWSAPYFHDGRAATLDDVLQVHPPGRDTPLTRTERLDLAAFLESL